MMKIFKFWLLVLGLILNGALLTAQESDRSVDEDETFKRDVNTENNDLSLEEIIIKAQRLLRKGSYVEAKELFEKASEISSNLYGAKHPFTLSLRHALGATLLYLGDTAKARDLYVEILADRVDILGPEDPSTLTTMSNLAAAIYELGDLGKAADLHTRILAIRRRVLGDEHPETTESMNHLGLVLSAQGEYSKARELMEEVLSIRRRILGEENRETMIAKSNLAVLLTDQGNFDLAKRITEEILTDRRRILGEDHPETLDAEHNLAGILGKLGELPRARELFEKVVIRRSKLLGPDHPGTLLAKSGLAGILYKLGDPFNARILNEKILETCRYKLGLEHPLTLSSMNNLAVTMLEQGDLSGARNMQEEALALQQKSLGINHPNTLLAMSNLAGVLFEYGDYSGARSYYRRSYQAFRDSLGERHPWTLIAMSNLAKTLHAQGDLASGRELYEEAFKVFIDAYDSKNPYTLTAMSNLVAIHIAQGDFVRAWDLGQKNLDITLRIKGDMHPDTAAAMTNLAAIRNLLGDYKEARRLLEDAAVIQSLVLGPDHFETLHALNNLATVLENQGDLLYAWQLREEVLVTCEEVLGTEHPDTVGAMRDLADTLYLLGKIEFAHQLHRIIIDHHEKRYGFEHKANSLETAAVLQAMALIYRETNLLAEARVCHYRALDALEAQVNRADVTQEGKSRFRSMYGAFYLNAVGTLIDAGFSDEALYTLERYRAQSLRSLLVQRRLMSMKIPAESEAQLRQLAARHDAIIREIDYLRRSAEGAERGDDFGAKMEELQNEKHEVTRQREILRAEIGVLFDGTHEFPLPMREINIRRSLDPGTLLLSYGVGKNGVYLFALSGDEQLALEVHKLAIAPDILQRQVRNFVIQLEQDACNSVTLPTINTARWLYDKLMEPVAELIDVSERLLILPDGSLHDLPFAALVLREAECEGARYLVEQIPIHIGASAAIYSELRRQRRGAGSGSTQYKWQFLAFGDPAYPDEIKPIVACTNTKGHSSEVEGTSRILSSWPLVVRSALQRGLFDGYTRLIHSGREVREIERMFSQGTAHTHLRSEATEEFAKEEIGNARIVHFAVHSVPDPLTPSNSVLALAMGAPSEASFLPDNVDNGLLYAWELLQDVRLKADLVVLSACQTALGANRGGEGLLSLSRIFQMAGARTVAASLWKVADESTAELMIRFYRHLLDGMSKDQALRYAQLELIRGPIETIDAEGRPVIRNFSSPYHWAAFQIIGDWQ